MTDLVQRLRGEADKCLVDERGTALLDEAADELARLRAECEALRADAGRYRWLRDGDGPESARWFRWRIEHWASPGPTWADIRGVDLDAAIDAARKGGEG